MKTTFEELQTNVIGWAIERGILETSDPKTQTLKCMSEVGELADNVAKGDHEATRDDLGDVVVTLILAAQMMGHDLVECVGEAYEEIKHRKGKMINGTFVKNADQ